MLTVDDYGAIRRARRDGMSIRQISRQFGHTRKTVRHVLDHAEPPTPTARDRTAPLLGQVEPIIDRILADDEDAPPKQRHTAAQIHRRLRDEHAYPGGYAQVQRYVLKHRRRHRETFIPLGHLPGRRMEADFGHIHVDFPDGRRPVPFLVAAWAYFNAPFVLALPFERTEAVLEGMVAAFEFFGGVPVEVWWDNPRTVATLILKGRERRVHPRYAALASHHVFEPRFCMPARGNEKPDAEGTVKAVQKRFATPVPRVNDLDELNTLLRLWCHCERDRVVRSLAGPFVIKDRLAEDLASASPLPRNRFEACVIHPAVAVDKYQSVAFDGNRYSVPRAFAFGLVTVKGFVDRVAIASGGQVVASHARSLEKSRMILDPLHFLAVLGRKPGSLDHAPVFRDWSLPACFVDFRGRLERQHGPSAGARQYARVLQLLTEHPLTRLSTAIETCVREQRDTADAVIRRTRALASIEAAKAPDSSTPSESFATTRVDVPLPDLSRFDQLLGRVEDSPIGVSYA
ncbi:IS21 family transposase [Isosphaeraceae bacterium EP7]